MSMVGSDSNKENNTGAGDGEGVTINVRCSTGSKFSVKVNLDSTVGSFKSILVQHANIPAENQRLIYKGRILKDEQTLEIYGLEADHTVHLVRGSGTAPSANPASSTNAGGPNIDQHAPRDAASNVGGPFPGSGLGDSLFPGLRSGGGGGLFGAGLPDFEQVQQQLAQNPNMMRDMLNMPLVQNLMNNPETIRNMIMNNPQMREIMERNPELAHVLNDPATLRQTMEAARNPELMREMMRNTDRAMGNIESSPEGFNMLRRMYENVQEPLLNATTLSGDTRNDVGSNPFAALLGAQGGGQGRHQSNNPPTSGSETTDNPPAPNTNPLPNPWASADTGAAEANTPARSNTAADTRAAPLGGLGGLASPGLEQMPSGMPDTTSLNQMMQNPAISQMMQSLLSNPQYMNQQLMSFQHGLLSQAWRQQTNQQVGQNAGGAAGDNGMEMLMNMFGGLETGGLGVPNRSNVPPEELYATQLTQLQEMGFFDTQENIRALIAAAGNVHAAVEQLIGNSGQ